MNDDGTETAPDLVDRAGARIADALDKIFGDAVADRVYTTLESGPDHTVIGASSIERAGGFGFGAGEAIESADAAEEPAEQGRGGGGGGGGWGSARPVAVIQVTDGGVRIWPVLDYTKLGLAAVAVLAAIWKARR